MASGLGQLVPDVEPITVMLINALTTDLDLNILHQNVTEPVQPAEGLVGTDGDSGQGHAEVHAVDEITVAADAASADNLTDFPSL